MKLAFWSEFGKISQRVQHKENPTDFEYGAQRFGTFLIRITAIMLGAVFLFHVWMREPLFKSRVGKGLCFATALSINAARRAARLGAAARFFARSSGPGCGMLYADSRDSKALVLPERQRHLSKN